MAGQAGCRVKRRRWCVCGCDTRQACTIGCLCSAAPCSYTAHQVRHSCWAGHAGSRHPGSPCGLCHRGSLGMTTQPPAQPSACIKLRAAPHPHPARSAVATCNRSEQPIHCTCAPLLQPDSNWQGAQAAPRWLRSRGCLRHPALRVQPTSNWQQEPLGVASRNTLQRQLARLLPCHSATHTHPMCAHSAQMHWQPNPNWPACLCLAAQLTCPEPHRAAPAASSKQCPQQAEPGTRAPTRGGGVGLESHVKRQQARAQQRAPRLGAAAKRASHADLRKRVRREGRGHAGLGLGMVAGGGRERGR